MGWSGRALLEKLRFLRGGGVLLNLEKKWISPPNSQFGATSPNARTTSLKILKRHRLYPIRTKNMSCAEFKRGHLLLWTDFVSSGQVTSSGSLKNRFLPKFPKWKQIVCNQDPCKNLYERSHQSKVIQIWKFPKGGGTQGGGWVYKKKFSNIELQVGV